MSADADTLSRVPPHDLEAEQSVLGAILLDNDAISQAREIVAADDFYRESHRDIFRAMLELSDHNQPIDAITLTDVLRAHGALEGIGGPAYLAELASIVPTAVNVAHYARIVRQKAALRGLASLSRETIKAALEGTGDPVALIARLVAGADAMRDRLADHADFPDADMNLIRDGRRPAPALPLDVFDPNWGAWMYDVAAACSAPVDYTMAPLLAAASALIGNSRRVSPWAGWLEPSIIRTARVGDSGTGKSPGADPVIAPLRKLEAELAVDFGDTLRTWEADRLRARLAHESWEQEVRATPGAPPALPVEAIEPPSPERPRILIGDATPEAIGRMLSANPRGLLSHHDELVSLLGGFDKYGGHGGERGLWIESFGGREHVIDRVKLSGAPIVVRFLSIAIDGGIQPDRLQSALLAVDDDGLAARFLYVWPEPVPPRRPDRAPDDEFVLTAFRRLLSIPMGTDDAGRPAPVTIGLTEVAADRFQAWREKHARIEREHGGMFRSWLAKQHGYVLRIALVLDMLDWSLRPHAVVPSRVSENAIGRAIRLVDEYLIPMASRTFGDAALPLDERNAAAIAKLIATRRIGAPNAKGAVIVNQREVQRRKLLSLRTAGQVAAAFAVLIDSGWIRPAPGRGSTGRERADFEVNPRVFSNGAVPLSPASESEPTDDSDATFEVLIKAGWIRPDDNYDDEFDRAARVAEAVNATLMEGP